MGVLLKTVWHTVFCIFEVQKPLTVCCQDEGFSLVWQLIITPIYFNMHHPFTGKEIVFITLVSSLLDVSTKW
jgi:hypothetical protein